MQKEFLCLPGLFFSLFLTTPTPPAISASTQEIVWKPLQRGLLYTRMETLNLLPGETVTVHVYSIDTSRYRLRLFDCLSASDGRPLSLANWYERTDALLLLNVCPEAEREVSTPYLRISGRTVRSHLRQGWKGLLVSDASGRSRPSTRIIDLQFTPIAPSDLPDPDVYQQPMLVDEKAEIRVDPRPYKAIRVALAEDRHRNLFVFLTEDACSLWDLARWLRQSPFSILRAINLGRGNTVQVLGRHPAARVYILGPASSKLPLQSSGILQEEAAKKENLCCVMGVVALEE